jgi:hypothetical protein
MNFIVDILHRSLDKFFALDTSNTTDLPADKYFGRMLPANH